MTPRGRLGWAHPGGPFKAEVIYGVGELNKMKKLMSLMVALGLVLGAGAAFGQDDKKKDDGEKKMKKKGKKKKDGEGDKK
jgi:hypothetical protein